MGGITCRKIITVIGVIRKNSTGVSCRSRKIGLVLVFPVDNATELITLDPVSKKSDGLYRRFVNSPQLNNPELVP